MTQFEFNLPMEELEMRTDKEHLMTKKMNTLNLQTEIKKLLNIL